MKVVLFGTPEFAVPTLRNLIESPHEVVAVVTQPDKPAGRGRKLTAPPVKQLALEHNLAVLQPPRVKTPEFIEEFRALGADVAVVVAYGKILPAALLDVPRHGFLNIHASLLPAYRGAAPIQWAIINGETKTGVTIMRVVEKLDAGPMIAKAEVEILEDDDAISVAQLLSLEGARLIVEVLDRIEREGPLPEEPQDEAASSYAPLLEREMARIDWADSFEENLLKIRGFMPWPKAHTTVGGKHLAVLRAEPVDPTWLPATSFDERVLPGTVVDVFKGRGFVVRTGGQREALLITRVQPEGKPEMGAIDFVNGGYVAVGSVLGK